MEVIFLSMLNFPPPMMIAITDVTKVMIGKGSGGTNGTSVKPLGRTTKTGTGPIKGQKQGQAGQAQ